VATTADCVSQVEEIEMIRSTNINCLALYHGVQCYPWLGRSTTAPQKSKANVSRKTLLTMIACRQQGRDVPGAVSSRRREVNRTEHRYIECLDVSLAFTSRGSMERPRSEFIGFFHSADTVLPAC
jgi:hypothetical protein